MTNIVQAPEPKTEVVGPVAFSATGLGDDEQIIDLNEIIKPSLIRLQAGCVNMKAILRCDELPQIYARGKELGQLFDQLIDFILQYPPEKSKLFLYIKCNQLTPTTANSEIAPELPSYEISFHTNSCNGPKWQAASQEFITQCETISNQIKGAFTYAFGNADFLFKITLPGKLL